MIVTLGESLIDFLPAGERDGAPLFEQLPGGAPFNVACGVGRLGGRAAFVGKTGEDAFGRSLGAALASCGVDTSGLVFTRAAATGLAFVTLDAAGERSFLFYRSPAADMLLEERDLPVALIESAAAFHFGSISLIQSPSREATLAAVALARRRGRIVSFDPNVREALWPSLEEARRTILDAAESADLLKLSEEELAFLAGRSDAEAAGAFHARGVKLVAVTRGTRGCSLYPRGSPAVEVKGFTVRVVDTTGAGDAFLAGFLQRLLLEGVSSLEAASPEQLARGGAWGNGCGALCCTRHGALGALPTRGELERFLAGAVVA